MKKKRYRILLLVLLLLLGFSLFSKRDNPSVLVESDDESDVVVKKTRKKEKIKFPDRKPASFGRVSFHDQINKNAPPSYSSEGAVEDLFIPDEPIAQASVVSENTPQAESDRAYFGFSPQEETQVPFMASNRDTSSGFGRSIGFSSVGLPPKAAPVPSSTTSTETTSSSSGSTSSPRPVISSITLDRGTLVIRGSDLDQITEMNVTGPSLSATLSNLTETSTEITARALSGVTLTLGTIYNLIISDAQGATTYPIEAELAPLTAGQDDYYMRWDGGLMRWIETPPTWEEVSGGIQYADDVGNGEVKAEVVNYDSTNPDKKIGLHAYGMTSTRPNTNTLESHNADNFHLYHNGGERITIDSGGNVGINNTNPTYQLEVKNQWGNSTIRAQGSLTGNLIVTGGSTFLSQFTSDNTKGSIGTTSDNGSIPFAIRTNGQDRIFVKVAGEVGVGTITPGVMFQVGESGDGTVARANAWNTFSDEKLKKSFKPIDESLRKIASIHGYSYEWKNGPDKKRQIGLKAQEVQKVFPEVVSKGSDGFLSVSYDKLIAPVIEAIKELSDRDDRRIRELEKNNDDLRRQNQELEKRLSRLERSVPER
jgi:hypothetical protein